jgi:Sulfotransferase family
MTEARPRAQVVLLAGLPHGGTTITNILLGQHPAVFSAGDLESFPHKQLNHFCSCGEPAAECPFWLDVRHQFAAFDGRDERRWMAFLYETICQQSGSRYVVDVCHDVQRTKELLKNPHVDFKVIHLIRDGKAVVHSRLRLDYETGQLTGFGWKHLSRTLQTTYKWRRHVSSLTKTGKSLGPRFLQIRYEDICNDIAQSLRRIGSFLDLDYGGVQRDLVQGRPLSQVPHLVRGKPALRRKRVREVVLTHDTRYVRDMALPDRFLFNLFGGRIGRAHLFRGSG